MSNESRVALDVSLYRSSLLEEVSSDVASLNVEDIFKAPLTTDTDW